MTIDNGKSVTANDLEALRRFGTTSGPVYFFMLPQHGDQTDSDVLPPQPPAYGTRERDALLRTLSFRESMWGDAVYKAASRIASFGWTIDDANASERRIKRLQDLLHESDFGAGWVKFILKVVKDYISTDNGAFVEIIRAGMAQGSRIVGLRHLDSLRCWRTGDPQYPVIYTDLLGHYHIMRDYQIMHFVDMPSSDPILRGIGQCAASRAYQPVAKLIALERYITEKLVGRKPMALYFVNGVAPQQLETVVQSGIEEALSQGFVTYMGAIVMSTMRPEAPQVASIELSGLPDRVDAVSERRDAYLKIAHAIGIFIGELQPLEGQYGTGTQSVILTESAQGQGLASFVAQWDQLISRDVCPKTTTFAFTNEDDLRDQRTRADISDLRAKTRAQMVQTGEMTPEQAAQMAVDQDEMPREFIERDMTPEGTISDDERLPAEGERREESETPADDEETGGALDARAFRAYAVALRGIIDEDLDDVFRREMDSAMELAEAAQTGHRPAARTHRAPPRA